MGIKFTYPTARRLAPIGESGSRRQPTNILNRGKASKTHGSRSVNCCMDKSLTVNPHIKVSENNTVTIWKKK